MGVEYPPSIDMFIDSPEWVFPDALLGLSGNELSIVIHKTASGGFQTATQIAQFFANDTVGHKSVHFIVGRDGSVIQVVRLKNGAGGNCCLEVGHDTYWDQFTGKHANLNTCTISIEHEDWTSDNSQVMTTKQIDASFALVKWLANKFAIPSSHVKGHNTLDPFSRKNCPGSTYPMSDLLKSLEQPATDFQLQAALLEWKSVSPDTPIGTGIYSSWLEAYRREIFYGPPLTHEYDSVDWSGNKIRVQQFSRKRAEWSNSTGTLWY